MNLRKLFALLMTAVMLLGMVPAGYAEGGNMMPGGEFTVSCNHNWAWRFPNGEPKHCQEERLMEMYCTLCGQVASSYPVTGDHTPGSWQWDGTPPANCYEWGIQNQSCSVCGEVFNEREVRGDHQWGSYQTVELAGCETPGEESFFCLVCGEPGGSREIPAMGHAWNAWNWEVEAECNQDGLRVRYCSRCNMREEEYVPGGNHRFGQWIVTQASTCTERGYQHRYCERCDYEEWDRIKTVDHLYGEWYVVTAPQVGVPGLEQRDCTYGCGTNEQREIPALEQEFIPAPPSISKVVINTPANGEYFVAGESIVYRITLTNNTGMALKGVALYDPLYSTPVISPDVEGSLAIARHLAVGESISGEFSYDVTAEFALSGKVVNTAEAVYVYADDPQAMLYRAYSNTLETPVGIGDLPELHCSFGQSNVPANNEYYVPGETVRFEVEYSNPSLYPLVMGYVLAHVKDAPGVDVSGLATMTVLDAADVPAGESAFAYIGYTVTEEDAARGAIYGYAAFTANLPNGTPVKAAITDFVTVPCGTGEPESAAGLELSLVLNSTPANGTHFVIGEEVTFTATWSNGTDKTLYPFSVSIWTCDVPSYGSMVDQICSWFAEDGGGPVAPGASGSHTLTVTVTEADVDRGAIYAMAELLSTVENGPDLENVTTPFVTVPCGPDNSGDFGLVNGLTVTKQVTSTPANGSYYEPGEDITFVITVSNQGAEPLLNVNVIDPLGGGLVTVLETLNAGETRDITVVFTTTDIVAWAGSVDNGACVKAVDKDGRQYVEYSNIVTVPCGHTFLDVTITPPFGIFHSLAVVKVEESMPLNGEYYTEGEVIHYSITYTNDGELPLTDVQVWDVMNVTTPVASAEMLNPGESRVCYYQHTVTAEDVAAGFVMNIAHASYPVPNDAGFANSTSNAVYSKTSADDNVWIELPIFPTPGEDPEYDPGTGWFLPDAGEETPDFGTIDTDALHGGETYCVRAITGRDNVSATYETTFCTEHADTQSSALIMAQAAATPELQMQSAAYAVALWRTEVESLYQEIFEAADPTAKTVVMTEYVRFLTDVANYEAMLKILYPDQPALVALKVAEIWENKCVDLCYDAHATAAERKDSLLAVTPTAGSSAVQCTCVTTSETNGQKTDVQSYCPVHSFPFSMIDALLQGKDTAESWTMVRRIWGVELTSAYNKIYEAMGDNKLLAMAEYNALTQWMMAREASLIALYPNNPEIVVQIMVKTIIERVNALCQVVN